MSLEKVSSLLIKSPKILIKNRDCFLYQFKEGGISDKEFLKWLDGKYMDIYEYQGRFGKTTKCPWCKQLLVQGKITKHIKINHPYRSFGDLNSIKLANHAYKLLLTYIRNNHYEALAFLIHRKCAYCEHPIKPGREVKCAIPEATRSRPRSIKELGLTFEGFNPKDYSKNSIAIVYY